MENESALIYRRLKYGLIIDLIISLYFTGLFETVVSHDYSVSFLPHKIFICCIHSGFNLGYFLLFFIVITCLTTHLILSQWKAEFVKDKLGRNITYNLDNQAGGDAHFADPIEYQKIAQIRKAENCTGKILGQLTPDGTACIDWNYMGIGSPHSLVAGTTGSGKTTTIILNYCLQSIKQRRSLIITDPKGELYNILATYLEDEGYVVRRFDLIDPQKSDGWDCMKDLRKITDDFQTEKEVDTWVDAIIRNISEGKDDVFQRGSRALLKAIALYLLKSKSFSDNERNIKKLNDILRKQSETGNKNYFDTIFNADDAAVIPAKNAYLTFKIGSQNLYGNICTHLATGLQALQSKIIEDILTTDQIDLELPAQQPCAYFCRFSPYERTYRFVSALFFTLLFTRLSTYADKQKNKQCPVPVDFVLDEFASIGILPGWEEKMSVMRSANLTALMVVQSYQQLEDNYDTKSVTIRSNCGTVINIGTNDEVTNKWFIDRIGETTVNTYTKNANSETQSVKSIKLMSSNELYQLCRDNSIIIFQGLPPIYARKFHYSMHPAYSKLKILSDDDIPNFYEYDKRNARNSERERKLKNYYAEHGSFTQSNQLTDTQEPQLNNILMDIYHSSEFDIFIILMKNLVSEVKAKVKASVKQRNKDSVPLQNTIIPSKDTNTDISVSPHFDDLSDLDIFKDFEYVSPSEQTAALGNHNADTPPEENGTIGSQDNNLPKDNDTQSIPAVSISVVSMENLSPTISSAEFDDVFIPDVPSTVPMAAAPHTISDPGNALGYSSLSRNKRSSSRDPSSIETTRSSNIEHSLPTNKKYSSS